jgi:uncharacterized membrane protein
VAASPLVAASAAGLFGIYADVAYNCFGATNSSPQTTELFAGDREDTLKKYVVLGNVQVAALAGVGFLALTVAGERALRWWPVIGAVAVAFMMDAMYVHAVIAGRNQTPPA